MEKSKNRQKYDILPINHLNRGGESIGNMYRNHHAKFGAIWTLLEKCFEEETTTLFSCASPYADHQP